MAETVSDRGLGVGVGEALGDGLGVGEGLVDGFGVGVGDGVAPPIMTVKLAVPCRSPKTYWYLPVIV